MTITTTPHKKTKSTPVLPTATSSPTPASGSDPPVNDPTVNDPSVSASTTTTPSSVMASSNAPPTVILPAVSAEFTPVNPRDYLGAHPKKGQLTALSGAIAELESKSSDYATALGPLVPPAPKLAVELTNAAQWTALRKRLQAFLIYVKSSEAICWKTALADLEKLNVIFQLLQKQNLALATEFPELTKLLDAPKVVAARATATRARNSKEKAKAAITPDTGATAAPAATPNAAAAAPVASSPSTAGSAGGGATH